MFFDAAGCADQAAIVEHVIHSQQWTLAAAQLEKAIQAGCGVREQLLIRLAQMRFLAGDADGAESVLIGMDTAAARYALGRIFYEQFRYTESADQFRRVIVLEPGNYRAHDNLALCYDALQQDRDAIRHFEVALVLVRDAHRDYDWAYANFAEFFLKRDQPDKAFQLAAEAAERNPQSARNFYLAGKALVRLEKFDTSLKWLERAVALDPNHAEARFQLGQALRRLGRSEEARAHLEAFRRLRARVR